MIDLAAASPEHKDLMQERLGRLRNEKREIEDRLREIDPAPVRISDPDAIVDTILEGLTDASRLFENSTMGERKRVVRAFVETLTLDGQNETGVLRIKKLPMPQNDTGNSSFKSLAGVLYEAQKRNSGREPEVVPVAFERRGTALVPEGAGR